MMNNVCTDCVRSSLFCQVPRDVTYWLKVRKNTGDIIYDNG